MAQDQDSEWFHVGRKQDTEEKGLPLALEAIRLAKTDPKQAIELASQAKDAVPYAWGAWADAFSYEVGGKGAMG
jgi:hypothetical protein